MKSKSAVLLCLVLGHLSYGQVPLVMNYQGRLINGTNLVNGPVSLSLRIFDAPTGGTLLYEDSNTVTLVDGLYATFLGDNTTFGSLAAALASTNAHIEVMIDGFYELAPRERIASVAYALLADGVKAGGITTPMIANSAVTSTQLAGNAVTSAKILNRNVTEVDVEENTFWLTGGNVDTTAGQFFLGTTDNEPLELRANNVLSLRLQPDGSFAAGPHAQANHAGSVVFADSAVATFASSGSDQFLVRASGGVGINTNQPRAALDVAGEAAIGRTDSPVFGMQSVLLDGTGGILFQHPGTNIALMWDDVALALTVTNGTVAGEYYDVVIQAVGEDLPTPQSSAGHIQVDEALTRTNGATKAMGWRATAVLEHARGPGFTFEGAGYSNSISGLVTYWY